MGSVQQPHIEEGRFGLFIGWDHEDPTMPTWIYFSEFLPDSPREMWLRVKRQDTIECRMVHPRGLIERMETMLGFNTEIKKGLAKIQKFNAEDIYVAKTNFLIGLYESLQTTPDRVVTPQQVESFRAERHVYRVLQGKKRVRTSPEDFELLKEAEIEDRGFTPPFRRITAATGLKVNAEAERNQNQDEFIVSQTSSTITQHRGNVISANIAAKGADKKHNGHGQVISAARLRMTNKLNLAHATKLERLETERQVSEVLRTRLGSLEQEIAELEERLEQSEASITVMEEDVQESKAVILSYKRAAIGRASMLAE